MSENWIYLLTYLLTYILTYTPWSIVLLKKLTGLQPVKKFPEGSLPHSQVKNHMSLS
jgi:hypothetical protein